jgi:hypothetical protein
MASGSWDRGGKFMVADADIDLIFRLDCVGGVVCACGAYAEEVDDFGQIDGRPVCPSCFGEVEALTTTALSRAEATGNQRRDAD